MILHDTVSIIIEKKEQTGAKRRKIVSKFLLIKRGNSPERNYWGVPGGHVDKGEKPLQAAVQECKEEVGDIGIISKKPVYIFVHDAGLGHRHKAHVFLGKVKGMLKAGSDAKRLGWFSLTQMKRLNLTHYTKKIFNKLFFK